MALPAYSLPAEDLWPAQGNWTWDDYVRIPDDGQRYEIIDGVLHVSPAPSYDHQLAVYELAALLRNFVIRNGLGRVLGAPFDVRLPGIANPVQPDLLFLRTENLPRPGSACFEGVPDLVVEVLSPGTRKIDQQVKLDAYQRAGVPEYWLVDPVRRSAVVRRLEDGEYRVTGRYRHDEMVRSEVLDGFEFKVSSLFPA